MGGDVAGKALEADEFGLPALAEAGGELAHVGLTGVGGEEAELPFEDGLRSGETVARQRRRHHPALGGAAEMEALDHAAASRLGELEDARTERAGNAERVGHLLRPEPHQSPRRHRGAEHPGQARRVETEELARMSGRRADPRHHLATGDERRQQRLAGAVQLFADGEARSAEDGAGMDPGARFAQAVELEGVGKRAVGKRRQGGVDLGARRAQDGRGAALTGASRVIDDDPAPRQAGAEQGDADGVGQTDAGALADGLRDVVIVETGGEAGKCTRRQTGASRNLQNSNHGRGRRPGVHHYISIAVDIGTTRNPYGLYPAAPQRASAAMTPAIDRSLTRSRCRSAARTAGRHGRRRRRDHPE